MLDFLFIILIFSEIALTYFAIIKILEFEKKITKLNEIVIEKGKLINAIHKQIQQIIKKVNFFVSILTNKRIWQIKKIITTAISIIEIIIVLKSFNMKKGVKSNLKNIKKLLFTRLSKQIAKKIFNTLALVC